MVTPSLKRYTSSRPSTRPPDLCSRIHRSLVGFSRLQGFPHALPVGETGTFQGLFPLSAIIAIRDRQGSSPAALRPQVFSTSRQRTVLTTGGLVPSRRHSQGLTFRVLLQTDRQPSSGSWHLRRYPSFMASFRNLADFPKSQPIRHYPIRPLPLCGPCSPAGLASIMDFDRPWRFAPGLKRFVDNPVSPGIPLCTSPGLRSFKVSPSPPWDLTSLPLSRFPTATGFFCDDSRADNWIPAQPSWSFCYSTLTPNSTLAIPRLWIPFTWTSDHY